MSLLRVESLTKSFGGFVALNKVSVAVEPGERLGLIGPNGSGKTTLINCISGALYCDDGRIEFDGRDVTRGEASAAFDRVKNPSHWKNPVDAIVEATIDETAVISQAVTFYTGSRPTIRKLGARVFRVTAAGYFATVGA